MSMIAERTTRSPTVPIGPSAGKRPLASAAPAWTLTMAPRIAGTGGMASRCVRLVSFIRVRCSATARKWLDVSSQGSHRTRADTRAGNHQHHKEAVDREVYRQFDFGSDV